MNESALVIIDIIDDYPEYKCLSQLPATNDNKNAILRSYKRALLGELFHYRSAMDIFSFFPALMDFDGKIVSYFFSISFVSLHLTTIFFFN